MPKTPKRPRDMMQLAHAVGKIATAAAREKFLPAPQQGPPKGPKSQRKGTKRISKKD